MILIHTSLTRAVFVSIYYMFNHLTQVISTKPRHDKPVYFGHGIVTVYTTNVSQKMSSHLGVTLFTLKNFIEQ